MSIKVDPEDYDCLDHESLVCIARSRTDDLAAARRQLAEREVQYQALREALVKVQGAQRLIKDGARTARRDINGGRFSDATDTVASIGDNATMGIDYINDALAAAPASKLVEAWERLERSSIALEEWECLHPTSHGMPCEPCEHELTLKMKERDDALAQVRAVRNGAK